MRAWIFSQLTETCPATSMPKSRRVRMWCTSSAEASSALDGMQPLFRQVPPRWSFSIMATLAPICAALSAAT